MSQPSDTTDTAAALRARFLEAGMRVLARDGYAGFKQSTVCAETGLTTGGFYHSFPNWKDFASALINHWQRAATAEVVAGLRTIGSPEERVVAVAATAKLLPHGTERALRVWAAQDPVVAAAVTEVDRTRRAAMEEFVGELVPDPATTARIAAHSMLLLIGYQCSEIDEAVFHVLLDDLLDETLRLAGEAAQTSE